jgi:hypothetical protein
MPLSPVPTCKLTEPPRPPVVTPDATVSQPLFPDADTPLLNSIEPVTPAELALALVTSTEPEPELELLPLPTTIDPPVIADLT